MLADHDIPDWYSRDMDDADVLPPQAMSSITKINGEYFFTGAIREMIRARKIPDTIEIAFDMDESAVVARLQFEEGGDGLNDENRWRAIYAYLSFEAFAILWNERPDLVHGIDSERFALHLNRNDMEIPTALGIEPVMGIIHHKAEDDVFHVFLEDLPAKEAA